MEPTDDVGLVCLRVHETNVPAVVAGSIQDTCSMCNSRVWIAKAGQNLLATHQGTVNIVCMECAMPNLDDTTKVEIAPGAVEEMLEHLRGER